MGIPMGIPTGENLIPIPIPFPWVWGSPWEFPYPRQPWLSELIDLSAPQFLERAPASRAPCLKKDRTSASKEWSELLFIAPLSIYQDSILYINMIYYQIPLVHLDSEKGEMGISMIIIILFFIFCWVSCLQTKIQQFMSNYTQKYQFYQ